MVRRHSKGRSVADIFDEVNDDLRAERAKRLAARYGLPIGLLVLLAAGGVVGWQGWRAYQVRQAGDVATQFMAATRDAGASVVADAPATPARAAAQAEVDRLAASGPAGYRTLARLRGAALRASTGDLPGALALWDALASDASADPLLRDLAALLAAQHQVDAGEPAALEARLQPLLAPGNPWRPMAQEAQALLALRTGRTDQAKDLFRSLVSDAAAPDGVRGRANGILTQLGETPPAPPPAAGAGG